MGSLGFNELLVIAVLALVIILPIAIILWKIALKK
jgi:hypothetical protein